MERKEVVEILLEHNATIDVRFHFVSLLSFESSPGRHQTAALHVQFMMPIVKTDGPTIAPISNSVNSSSWLSRFQFDDVLVEVRSEKLRVRIPPPVFRGVIVGSSARSRADEVSQRK